MKSITFDAQYKTYVEIRHRERKTALHAKPKRQARSTGYCYILFLVLDVAGKKLVISDTLQLSSVRLLAVNIKETRLFLIRQAV